MLVRINTLNIKKSRKIETNEDRGLQFEMGITWGQREYLQPLTPLFKRKRSEDNFKNILIKRLKFRLYSNHGIMVTDTSQLMAIALSILTSLCGIYHI